MIHAFFGLTARFDAAHAALIVADAFTTLATSVTLLRVTLPGEPQLPSRSIADAFVSVLEREADDPAAVAGIIAQELMSALLADREIVLDLPAACLVRPEVMERIDIAVATVGPTPIDEHAAACFVTTAFPEGCRPPWLLACGRAGGARDVAAFASNVRTRAAAMGCASTCRILPAAFAPLTRHEAEYVADGDRTGRSLRIGLGLVAALRATARHPEAAHVPEAEFATALLATGEPDRQPDERDAVRRLHDLADEIGAIGDGFKPTEKDLEGVPRLEDWSFEMKPVRVLAGRAFDHPDIPDGRRITSSDLYASDGASWARTLSRYWTLGKKAGPPGRRRAAR